jgi:hypothetical protein
MRQFWMCALVVFVMGGCGSEEAPFIYSLDDGPAAPAEKPAANGEDVAGEQAGIVPGDDEGNPVERKMIYVAEVSLVVEEFSKTDEELSKLIKQFDGYFAAVSVDRTHGEHRSGRWVARIPVAQFDAFLDALEDLGIPERRHVTAQDVTEEFVDLQARITNKQRLEERILKLLEDQSGEIKEVIEVERELARVRGEIEQMAGRLRYLKNRTALTTVTINAREERDYVAPQAPTFAARTGQAWTGSLQSLRQAGEWATIALVTATPWLVLVLPGLWYVRRSWKHRRKANPIGVEATDG